MGKPSTLTKEVAELSPQEGKVDKIVQERRPDTKKELRSFLGVVGYYREFIENFTAVAKPLTDMTKKGESDVLRWNRKSEEAYEEFKRSLSQHPILRLPQFDKELILTTNASQEGIAAVLSQEYEGVKMPVMYISRKLIPAETRYSAIEQVLSISVGSEVVRFIFIWKGICARN